MVVHLYTLAVGYNMLTRVLMEPRTTQRGLSAVEEEVVVVVEVVAVVVEEVAEVAAVGFVIHPSHKL